MKDDLNAILLRATREHWATGHFNVSESDQFRVICEAAREVGTCAIIGTSEGEARHIGYFEAVALRDAFRKEFGIPVFLNSDHHKSVESAKAAIDAGYGSIHIDLSAEPFDENVAGTKEIVLYARAKNPDVSVEGELGYLRGESKIQKEKIEIKPKDLTNPDEAAIFVEKTGVNRLAIAVGNSHGISPDEPRLDIERIRAIRERIPTEVALVLHGGSGIPDDQFIEAIKAGIANIHINTELRVAFVGTLRKTLAEHPDEVAMYKLDEDAKHALKEVIKNRLMLFGAANRI